MTRTIYANRPIGKIPVPTPLPWKRQPKTALYRKHK